MEKDLMEQFYEALSKGIKMADEVRDKLNCHQFQSKLCSIATEVKLTTLVFDVLNKYPEKKSEVQREILTFYDKGERYENPLLNKGE